MNLRNTRFFRRKLKPSDVLDMLKRSKGDNPELEKALRGFEAHILPVIGMQTRILSETQGDFEPRVQLYLDNGDGHGWALQELRTGNPIHSSGGYTEILEDIKGYVTSPTLTANQNALAVWQFPFRNQEGVDTGACLVSHRSGSTLYAIISGRLRSLETSTAESEDVLSALMRRFGTFQALQSKTAPELVKRMLNDREPFDKYLKSEGIAPKKVGSALLTACINGIIFSREAMGAITGYVQALTDRLLHESHNSTMAVSEMVRIHAAQLEKAELELKAATDQVKAKVTKNFQTQLDNTQRILAGVQARSRRLEQELVELRKSGGSKPSQSVETTDPVARALEAYFS